MAREGECSIAIKDRTTNSTSHKEVKVLYSTSGVPVEYNQQCGTVGRVQCDSSRQVELLRNWVSGWSCCAIGSAGGAIAQPGQVMELLQVPHGQTTSIPRVHN